MRNIKLIILTAGSVFILSCFGLAVAVISDLSWLQGLCIMAATAAIIVMPVSIIVAFCMRKFATGLAGLGLLAVSLTIGFFTMILIGAGQHHPPKYHNDIIGGDSIEWVEDSLEVTEPCMQPQMSD